MAIYCDESGYTGYDLLEENQPYFVYAALNIDEDEAKAVVIDLKTRYYLQGELKGKNLVKTKNGKKAISEVFVKYSRKVKVVFHHKKYALACKYFEYVFEPTVSDRNQAFYLHKFHRFIANLVYIAYQSAGDKAEDIFLRFQELIKGNDPEGLFKLLQSKYVPNELISLIAEFTVLHKKSIMDEITTGGEFDYWILDLAQTALHGLLCLWSMKLGSLTVVIDESKPLKEAVDRNPLYHRLNAELVYFDPFGDGETAINFSLKEPVTFSNSRKCYGLQLADIFASSVYWTLLHPDDDFSEKIRGYSDDYIPSPNNLCINPEPGVYLDPDSIEFSKGAYFLWKLVELSRIKTDDLGNRFADMLIEKVEQYKTKNSIPGGTNKTAPKKKRKKRK